MQTGKGASGGCGRGHRPPEALFVLAVTALFIATPANSAVRTLFVGINAYANSVGKPGNADPKFHDLKGAVNDVMMIRQVLADRWKVSLGNFAKGACEARSGDGLSVTLTDACASRASIVGALTDQLTAAAPGDTLLFYYAGHGAQLQDLSQTQAGGASGTIVPQDSRGAGVVDIVDRDLGRLIDAGVARGVNVVTIFDSCNSGTGTRDLRGGTARAAPPASAGSNADIAPPPPRSHSNTAYRVHLAAAADGEAARELSVDGVPHGIFSLALQQVLSGLDQPAYTDILDRVRSIYTTTRAGQTPDTRLESQQISGEGALQTLFLGQKPVLQQRIIRAIAGPTNMTLKLLGGTLSGVTIGSSYRVFGSTGAAISNGGPSLAAGTITGADYAGAVLTLAAPLTGSSATLQAVEIDHVAGGAPVRLRIDGGSAADRAAITAAIATASSVKLVSDAADYILVSEASGWQLRGGDRSVVGSAVASGDLSAQIPETVTKLAQYFTLASLPNVAGAALRADALSFSYDCDDDQLNPDLARSAAGEAELVSGQRLSINFKNSGASPRYTTLVMLRSNLGIGHLVTASDRLGAGETLLRRGIRGGAAGRNQILLLLTDGPVDTASLDQEGIRSIDPMPMGNPLERLLARARRGQASRDLESVGAFQAIMATVNILPAGSPSKAPTSCTFKPKRQS